MATFTSKADDNKMRMIKFSSPKDAVDLISSSDGVFYEIDGCHIFYVGDCDGNLTGEYGVYEILP